MSPAIPAHSPLLQNYHVIPLRNTRIQISHTRWSQKWGNEFQTKYIFQGRQWYSCKMCTVSSQKYSEHSRLSSDPTGSRKGTIHTNILPNLGRGYNRIQVKSIIFKFIRGLFVLNKIRDYVIIEPSEHIQYKFKFDIRIALEDYFQK